MNTDMEIPKEINISEVKRTVMYDVDLSNDIRYSALVNGERIMTMTDGWMRPHMTIEQWVEYVVIMCIKRYNELHEANK
jgi:hypothetical protein